MRELKVSTPPDERVLAEQDPALPALSRVLPLWDGVGIPLPLLLKSWRRPGNSKVRRLVHGQGAGGPGLPRGNKNMLCSERKLQ